MTSDRGVVFGCLQEWEQATLQKAQRKGIVLLYYGKDLFNKATPVRWRKWPRNMRLRKEIAYKYSFPIRKVKP